MSIKLRIKLSLASLLILFVCGFAPIEGWAYYQNVAPSKAFEPIRVPMGARKLKNISGIGVYENMPSDDYQFSRVGRYHPAKWEYTPLDIISLKKTIPLRYCSSLTSENQLAQLIYADIKIKRLIDEYTRLQSKMHSLRTASREKIAVTRTAIALKGRETSSMYATIQLMEQGRQELTSLAMRQMDTSGDINLLLSLTEFVEHMNKDIFNKNTKEILFSEDQDLANISEKEVGSSEHDDDLGFGNIDGLAKKNGQRKMNGAVKQPPKIINFFAICVGYFLNNKIEVLFYLTVLATVFIFITSAIKR